MSRSAATTTLRLARAIRPSQAVRSLTTVHPAAPAPVVASLSARRFKSTSKVMSDPMTGESIQLPDLDASLVQITKTDKPKPKPASSKLVFGHTFTDHMIQVNWNSTSGWGTPEIKPYGPLQLDPSATVLHYAFTCFEGTKAYKAEDGSIRLFRLDKNMARMNRSAQRIALPQFDGDQLVELIKKLVVLDSEWIPREKGYSLYLRPTLMGTQNALGVAPSNSAMLFVIACPVGPYYASGFKPVQLQATTKYKRAWPGGTGGYKLGSNYATGVTPQKEAAKEGYSQNLWLLGEEDMLTEVGTMNLFVAFKHADGTTELVTPPLEDLVLPGVIRDSVLSTARDHASGKARIPGLPDKLKVSERKLVMADLVKAEQDGTLAEVFGSGTAVVISPVDAIGYKGRDIKIPCGNGDIGPIAKAMLDRIVGIQTGEVEHEWSIVANPKGSEA